MRDPSFTDNTDTKDNGTRFVYVRKPSVFFTKIPSTVVLSIALLLFFLPFMDLRCNGFSIKRVSGMEMAVGLKIPVPGKYDTVADKIGSLDESGNAKTIKKEGFSPR